MEVIYSVGSRLGSTGSLGSVAYSAVRAIHRRGYLKRLLASSIAESVALDRRLCRSMGWPGRALQRLAALDPSSGLYEAIADWGYDLFARQHVERCDIFHGWGLHSLFSLRKAKHLGAITLVERASSHILTQDRLLREEFALFGARHKPIPKIAIDRSLAEFHEADFVVVPSQFAYDSFLDQGYSPAKLIVNPFGVDTEAFQPEHSSDGVFRVLFLGQIGLRKGVQYLLQAWAGLGLKNAELVLVGNVNDDIREWLRPHEDAPNVRFMNYTRNLNEVCGRSSVFAFPSIEEGSALVTYIAMACGLPSVVTHNAGSVARDGQEGCVVPIRDVAALKEKIVFLYENEDVRREMGEAARRRAEEFTWERHGDRLVDAYERIIGGARTLGGK